MLKQKKRYVACLIYFGILCLISGLPLQGFGKDKGKTNIHSPSAEDMANYFSENRQGISLENLKKAEELRLQTIESINKLIKTNIKDNYRFELYLRLGELHSERHDYLRDIEIKQFETKFDQWDKNGRKGKEPTLSHKGSKAALVQSVNAFRKLVREYPRHPRTDSALYSLAKTMLRLENDNAVLYFRQLIKNHPNSPLIPETYLALGEFYFYKHDMNEALENYKAAMKYRNSRVYPFAVYKLGWAYFNLSPKSQADQRDQINKAITAFKLVIKLADVDKDQSRNLNLRREAINDLIVVFAENERTQEALAYFKQIGENEAFYDMLEKLANIYEENGDHAKAITIFDRLLREAPTRKDSPENHLKLVNLYDKLGQLKNVVGTLNVMNTLYVNSSQWISANQSDTDRIKSAAELTQKNIHRFAAAYHKTGYKTKRSGYLVAASQLYQIYLESYPKSEEAYELRYYLADIYFYFKKYEDAANEYIKVSRERPKDGKFLKESALNAVVAIKRIDEAQKYEKLPPLGQVPKPMPVPRVKAKLIQVMDNFVELLPSEKDGFPMRYTSAQTYFEYGHYDEGLKRFDILGRSFPTTLQGKSAVKMILTYYSEKKDWEQLVKISREYLADEGIVKSGQKEDITKMLKFGMFSLGVAYSKQNRHFESANTFVQYQKEFPTASDADDALYNATLGFYKEAKVEEALSAGKTLLSEYPKSKYAKDVALDIAQTNEALANFPEAASFYKTFGLNYLSHKRARLALYNSATLYKGLNNYKESIDLFEKFIRLYPKDSLSVIAHKEIADQMKLSGDERNAVVFYERHARKVGYQSEEGLLSRALAGELMIKSGNVSSGLRELDEIRSILLKKDAPAAFEARRIVARSIFNNLDGSFNNFKAIKIQDAKSLERDVKTKQNRLVALVKNYEHVIEIGSGEYTVAALYRVGEMHEDFADELFDAPAPKGASQVEVDQYRSSIEKVAFPLKEEARKFFEAAYVRSKEVQTLTEWTRLTRAKMVEIDAESYPMISEKNTDATYMSHNLIWNNTVASFAE